MKRQSGAVWVGFAWDRRDSVAKTGEVKDPFLRILSLVTTGRTVDHPEKSNQCGEAWNSAIGTRMRSLPLSLSHLFQIVLLIAVVASGALVAPAQSMEQVLSYSFVSGLTASDTGDRFAWVENVRGVRNIWFALATDRAPHQLTHYTKDDGQELTGLVFSADGSQLVFVRGGDHDENWPAAGNLAPDPDGDPTEPKITIWSSATDGKESDPAKIAEGDSPAVSATGQVAYVKDSQIWCVPLAREKGKAAEGKRLFFDRGKDDAPVWSKDGMRLAFVSAEGRSQFYRRLCIGDAAAGVSGSID